MLFIVFTPEAALSDSITTHKTFKECLTVAMYNVKHTLTVFAKQFPILKPFVIPWNIDKLPYDENFFKTIEEMYKKWNEQPIRVRECTLRLPRLFYQYDMESSGEGSEPRKIMTEIPISVATFIMQAGLTFNERELIRCNNKRVSIGMMISQSSSEKSKDGFEINARVFSNKRSAEEWNAKNKRSKPNAVDKVYETSIAQNLEDIVDYPVRCVIESSLFTTSSK